ncbi:MAG: hypothetical protein K5872_07805 [Rhizobiaceae bacterium]|nr:hypothetical protein [Rhizobiaceae bacterium]MCV0406117.1 hypothetical protein [Rhizobiaceae bacterium]
MPLQNRVDPFGAIHRNRARGLFTGNRGVIHDPGTKTLTGRRWTTKAWIVCRLDLDGRRRDVMGLTALSGRAGWTELFFLDEVTALAAGHRPCFFCRRRAATDFARCFPAGPAKAGQMDGILHAQRPATGADSVWLEADEVSRLPDGAVIAVADKAFAVRDGRLLEWSWTGYRSAEPGAVDGRDPIRLLTPAATVDTLRNGYRPVWHPSAGS